MNISLRASHISGSKDSASRLYRGPDSGTAQWIKLLGVIGSKKVSIKSIPSK
eukprot:c29575_g1_i1 orf=183-338(+)